MERFLFNKAQHLLEASLKLTDLGFRIQKMLQDNYSGLEIDVGSIFRAPSSGNFMYSLMVNCANVGLDAPIYSIR